MNILIVDDETIIREWLQMSLLNASPKINCVTTAIDGLDALEKLSSMKYDAIFIDIQMPRMDGLTLLKEIRKTHPDIPVIILSSHTQFDYAREVMRLGALEYLLKTECTKELLSRVIEKIENEVVKPPAKITTSLSKTQFLRNVLTGNVANDIIPFDECNNNLYFIFSIDNLESTFIIPEQFDQLFTINFISTYDSVAYYLAIFPYINNLEVAQNTLSLFLAQYSSSRNIRIGSSKIRSSSEQLESCIISAYLSMQQLFYINTSSCSQHVTQWSTDESSTKDNLLEITNEIIKTIRNYNNSSIISSIETLNKYILQNKPNNVRLVKDAYYNVLNALYMHYYSNDSKLTIILEDVKHKINNFKKMEELLEFTTTSINLDILLLSPNAEYSTHIKSALLYIAENYDSISSVREIGDAIHLNFDYFTRLFKKEVGENINSFLRNYRLNMAALMLKTTLFPISDIALRVGMGNISYFSKTFKELYGMQPIAYRNLFRE
ncbi:MAG: response regulator [Eubacteriales bacterium]